MTLQERAARMIADLLLAAQVLMTTTDQQDAVQAEREAVERIAAWLFAGATLYWWEDMRVMQVFSPGMEPHEAEVFNPFTHPADERELLTAVQERWGRPALENEDMEVLRRWSAFRAALDEVVSRRLPVWSSHFLMAYLQPGDIARAVDAVLVQYPEEAT